MTPEEQALWVLAGTPRLTLVVQGERFLTAIHEALEHLGWPPEVLVVDHDLVERLRAFVGSFNDDHGHPYVIFVGTKVYLKE